LTQFVLLPPIVPVFVPYMTKMPFCFLSTYQNRSRTEDPFASHSLLPALPVACAAAGLACCLPSPPRAEACRRGPHSPPPALPATCAAAGLACLRRHSPCLLLALAPHEQKHVGGAAAALACLPSSLAASSALEVSTYLTLQ
jgi:hypothetical protein